MDNPPRAGKDHRINQDRFFHVMGQGWYVMTREGVDGPFMDKTQVNDRIRRITQPQQTDTETSQDEPAPWEDFFLR